MLTCIFLDPKVNISVHFSSIPFITLKVKGWLELITGAIGHEESAPCSGPQLITELTYRQITRLTHT